MPPFQTSTAIKPAAGYPGMMADASEWNGVSGFILVDTAKPGHPVSAGTQERAFIPFTEGQAFVGILRAHITAAPKGVFTVNEMIAASDEGHIFVQLAGPATARSRVYWDADAEGYTSTAAGNLLIPGAEFIQAGAVGDNVIVNLRKMPGVSPFSEAVALVVDLVAIEDDAAIGTVVADLSGATTYEISGLDSDILEVDGAEIKTTALIAGRTTLNFNVIGRADGKLDASQSVSAIVDPA